MRTTITLIAAALTAMAALAPVSATAREGSVRSIGGGIKCYYTYIAQPDGTLKYTQVCYKGV